MNWKTLGEAILVMVGLFAITAALSFIIIYVIPLWISLAIAFSAGVSVVYHMIEKEDDYSDDEEEEDETKQTI